MTALLVVGTDNALIEGIAQILTADYKLYFVRRLTDALETLGDVRPIMILVERSAIDESRMTLRVPLAPGGAFVVFHGDDTTPAPLPHRVQRATLAELQLPLERQRLLALIRYVEKRAQTVGWDSIGNGEEMHAP